MSWYKRRSLLAVVATGSIAVLLAACGSSNSSSSPTTTGGTTATTVNPNAGCPGDPPNQIYTNINASGTPQTGGTLTVLGTSDVDEALDINIGYYTLDYLAYDLYNRPLYTYPSIKCQTFTLAPDIANGPPVVSNGGLQYAVTIRTGAMWDSTPPRQVTAADVVRGVERSCNPTLPFGGQADFSDILAGYSAFCTAFSSVSATSATAQAAFINTKASLLTGVTVDPSNPLTVDFTLTKPASYFTGILNLPPFNPAPVESLQSLPGSATAWKTVLSDGPYEIQSYDPNKSIVFVRNPAWSASSDPIDKAYVNEIDINETGNEQGIYQQVITNSPSADMLWDIGIPPSEVPGLLASKDPRFGLYTEGATNPYIIFNTISKNNTGALANVKVRQALEYAISRTEIVQNHDGPNIAVPLTHIIAPAIQGGSPNFDDYPYNPTLAKSMLAAAGYPHLTLKFLYRGQNITAVKDFETLQSDFSQIGVTLTGVNVSNADFYGKYLVPGTAAKNSVWDLAEAGWGPDWYPNGGKSYFLPILDGSSLPPNSSNFGFFNDPKLNSILQQALAAPDDNSAAALWHQADVEAMSQAALFPIADPNAPTIHGSQVHNYIYIGPIQNANLANVWLSS